MAVVTPINNQVGNFDATKDKIFSFYVNGGDQVVKNKLTIRDNSTNKTVYENTVETYEFQQTVPANTLTNGVTYNFYFTVYNSVNEQNFLLSAPVLFTCYNSPKIKISNLIDGQTIDTSSFDFTIYYNQEQKDKINEINVYLYDNNGDIISLKTFTSQYNPPLTLTYSYDGFENNKSYKIKAFVSTMNGMKEATDLISFNVSYDSTEVYSVLDIERDNEKGYNIIKNNFKSVLGISTKDHKWNAEVPYVNIDGETYADFTQNNYLEYSNNFTISKNFIFTMWFRVGVIGKIVKLGKQDKKYNKQGNVYYSDNDYYTIEYRRDYDNKKDYVVLKYTKYTAGSGSSGSYMTYIDKKSNKIDMVNGTTNLMVWFKYGNDGEVKELKLVNVDDKVIDNYIYINGNSNVKYNSLSTYNYGDNREAQNRNIFIDYDIDTSNLMPITYLKLSNCMVNHMNITKNIDKEFSTDIPSDEWQSDYILNCNFNNTTNAGNVNIMQDVNYVLLKSRQYGTQEWKTLRKYYVYSSYSSGSFIYYDYTVPSNVTMEYAIVPILNDGSEAEYIKEKALPLNLCSTLVIDSNESYSFNANVSYGENVRNIQIGSFLPLASKYPIIVRNGEGNYESGSFNGYILSNDMSKLNRQEIVEKKNKILDFLTNGKPKIIKDWNGNIWLVQISDSPSVSYESSLGNGLITVSFSWVEQGKWDNQDDLYRNGISNYK